MTIDIKALAAKLIAQEQANQRASVQLNTEDPQRDKFWRIVGKKIRKDARQTR